MYRNYYQYNPGFHSQYIRPRMFGGAVKTIIIANVSVFLLMLLFRLEELFAYYFGLVPQFVWSRGFVWQLVTYMFIHGSFGHLFINMFILWMFGSEIEATWGHREFYKFYCISGIGSGLITLLFSINSTIPVVGASGAIYALLVAFAVMYPNRLIFLYFLIPVKAKYLVLIMGIFTFFSSFSQGAGGISHLTHLGGLVIGYIYLKRHNLFSSIHFQIPQIKFKNPFKNPSQKHHKKSSPRDHTLQGSEQTMREELDRLLDKINRSGYESLDETERKNLVLIGKYFAEKDKQKN